MSSHDNSQPHAKRQKIKKACDNCRTRKIKCDGEQPCFKCSASSTQCLYTHVEKKRVVKKKDPKLASNSIENLDNRMNKMESLITTLIEKLNGPISVGSAESLSPESKGTESTSNESSLENSPEADNQQPLQPHQHQKLSNGADHHPDGHDGAMCGSRTDSKLPEEEKFIGSQSSLSVLSPRGVMWLAKKSNDPNLTHGFKALIGKSHKVFYNYMRIWMEPIEKSEVVPLPPKAQFYELLDYFHDELSHFTFTISYNDIHEIADNYYKAQEGKHHKHISNSDYLILHGAIALATTFHFEKCIDDKEALSKVQALEERHLKNAIFYFHRILTIGEGLKSVQGILLLVAHTNTSLLPQANFMLLSTAIRLAQAMGLHRSESYVGLNDEQKKKRRGVWWICYLSDRINCLKAGKPMTISEHDISPMETNELKDLLLAQYPVDLVDKVFSAEYDLMKPEVKQYFITNININPNVSVSPFISYFISNFFKFTSETYDKLFSATALSGKTADQIMELIETLNFNLEAINDNIPASIRPGTHIRLGLYNDMVDHHLLMLHFSYYLHVMIVNRMSFKRSWLNLDQSHTDDFSKILPRQRKSIGKCLDAARNILKIVQYMDVYKCSIFNVSLFVFFSSFFTLLTACLEFPTAPETKTDLELMKQTAEGLFSKLSIMTRKLGDDKMVNIIDNFTKYFLRVGILVFNNSNQDQLDISTLDRDLKNYEQSLDSEEQLHSSRKRKRGNASDPKNPNGPQAYSPNNPSSLSHVRSASGYNGHYPNAESPLNHNGSSRRPSQPNTPDLNNILNDPISSIQSPNNRDGSRPYAPSIRSTSSTTEGFDPFSLNNDFDISSNSNVFQQLFPIPNLYFGNAEAGNSMQGFPGHFEW